MNNYLEEYEFQRKKLKRKIISIYVWDVLLYILLYFFSTLFYDYLVGDNTGIDGIGVALVVAFGLRIIIYFFIAIFFIIKPIIIMIKNKNMYKEIIPKSKKIIYIIFSILPILLGLLVIFENSISNIIYDLKYNTGKNAYTVESKNYKTSTDFYNELKDRNLLYDSDTITIKNKLNTNKDCYTYKKKNGEYVEVKCYEEATMVGSETSSYYDKDDNDNEITDTNEDYYPFYVYNSILTLPSKNDKLTYAALGRYSYNYTEFGNDSATFNDYYIECKIVYVDGDIYAIIGLGESYDIKKYYENIGFDIISEDNYPFNMIISEKDNITTYVDGKYYPYGSIENNGSSFEMTKNTRELYTKHYPVKVIDRLDKDAINEIAEELQENILKESIKYHYNQ